MIPDLGSTLDPGIAVIAQLIVATVFALAAAHKIKAPKSFVATLGNYRLIPDALAPAAAGVIIFSEIAITMGLAAGSRFAALAAMLLLVVYTGAIGINLLRGRRDIDCGCSGPAMRQTLQPWLLVRNALLIGIAATAALPAGSRPLTLVDLLTTIATLLGFILLYSAANHLSATASRYVR